MKRTISGRIWSIIMAQDYRGVCRLDQIEIPTDENAIVVLVPELPASKKVTVSWEDGPEPPCKHLLYTKLLGKFYIEDHNHVYFVTYCPVCGARVPCGYEA